MLKKYNYVTEKFKVHILNLLKKDKDNFYGIYFFFLIIYQSNLHSFKKFVAKNQVSLDKTRQLVSYLFKLLNKDINSKITKKIIALDIIWEEVKKNKKVPTMKRIQKYILYSKLKKIY